MYIPDDAEIRNLEDRRTRVLVDRDDDFRVLHTSQMLDCARDAARDIQIRADRLTGLADLAVFLDPPWKKAGIGRDRISRGSVPS